MAPQCLVKIHSSCLLYEVLSVSLDACTASTSSGVGIPSITLPSFQFPGLLCFGGGFLNLITPFFESFFVLALMSSATRVGHESVQMRLHVQQVSRMPTFRISHRDGCIESRTSQRGETSSCQDARDRARDGARAVVDDRGSRVTPVVLTRFGHEWSASM